MVKKVMMLGGNYFQMTAVKAAKRLGCRVIDVDYLPDNPAHKYADEYYDISTVDREAVLAKARELGIDGIVSYASDVSAPTAAYVSEQMGLPTNPLESVTIMTNKALFREFLLKNGFPAPQGRSFTDCGEASEYAISLGCEVVVKPVDSSGSKGVNRLEPGFAEEAFREAFDEAFSYSLSGTVIVEQFIRRKGYQIDGDIFVVGGEIKFWGICDQHHDMDCSAYAPTGHSFPPTQAMEHQMEARAQIERVLRLLKMHMGAYNTEYIVSEDGVVYLLEIAPRNGGNLITDAIRAASGVDLAEYTVKAALGEDCSDLADVSDTGCAASYVIHARSDGIFRRLEIDPALDGRIVQQGLFVKDGDPVRKFRNAAFGIGAMVMKFDNVSQMCGMMEKMHEYVRVIVDPQEGSA